MEEGSAKTVDESPKTEPPKEDAPAAKSGNWLSRMGWGKKIGLIVLALLLVGVVAALVWVNTPPEAKAYQDPIDRQAAERNDALYVALTALGLGDPLVSQSSDGLVAAYDLPEAVNDTTAADQVQRMVLGAMVGVDPNATAFTAVGFLGGEPYVVWKVDGDRMRAFAAGSLSTEEFEAGIEKQYP